jgi:hypothetical protein
MRLLSQNENSPQFDSLKRGVKEESTANARTIFRH